MESVFVPGEIIGYEDELGSALDQSTSKVSTQSRKKDNMASSIDLSSHLSQSEKISKTFTSSELQKMQQVRQGQSIQQVGDIIGDTGEVVTSTTGTYVYEGDGPPQTTSRTTKQVIGGDKTETISEALPPWTLQRSQQQQGRR